MADMKGQLEFDVEAGGASATIGALKRDLASLGRAAKDAGESSAQGMKQAADAGNSAASKLDAATSSMVSRIKRSMAELANGMKGSIDADLAERMGAARGLNPEALKPWIDALRQAETGARAAARAQQLIDAANQQSLAAERELAKLRNQSQQQAGQDFLTSQRTAQAQATQRAIEAQRELVRALDAVNQAQRQGADAQTTSIVNEALVQAKQRSAAANAALADIGNGYRKTAEDLAKLDAEATARGERAARALAGLRAAADKAAKDAFYAPQRERDAAAAEATTRAQQAQEAVTRQLLASERDLAGLRTQEQRTAAQDFLSAQRTAQAQATKRLTDAQQELQRAIEAVNQAERNGTSGASAKSRVDAAQQQVAAATAQMSALQQATSSGSADIRSRDAFISALQREAAAVGKTRSELLALEAAERGVAAQADPMIRKLREAEAGLGRTGVSAAQTAAAMRMVPAQMTDIITQLQMGTSPLTILVQQGGQLRDMFGSVGGALRGLWEGFKSLISPVTVLGAAAIGLAAAYQKGASESAAFARSLVLTNNAAGITEGQFNQMARAVSEASNTTIGSARATTQALVSMGQLSGGTLQRAAVATQLLAKVTGESAEQISKRFSDAKEAPAKFAAELNKQYNLLTASQMAEIRALENQGRAQEALNKTFDALIERTGRAADNFSLVERWWNTLKMAASEPINFIINYGRAPTAEDALADAEKRLAELNGPTPFKNAPLGDAIGSLIPGNTVLQDRRRDAEALVQSLRDSAKLGQDVANAQSRGNENQRARSAWDEVRQRNLTNEEKKVKEIAEAEAKATAAKRDASDVDRKRIDRELETERKKIADRYKEPKGSAAPFNDQNRAEVEAIRQAEQIKLEIIKQSQSQVRLLRDTEQLTEIQAIEETTRLELRALETRRDSLLQQADAVAKKENSRGEAASKRREAALIEEQINTRRIEGENALTAAIEKREQAWLQATANENADFAQRAFDEARSLREQADAQLLANESIRLGAVDVAKLEAAKMLDTAASKERIAAQWEEQGVNLELARSYNEQAAALRDLARGKVAGAVSQQDFGLESKARQELDAFLDPARAESFGDALRDAFGGAGNALRGLLDVFDDFGRKQAELGKQRKNLELISDPTERMEKEVRLQEASVNSQIQGYANLAGAAKGFFDEGSKGYRTLQAAEAAFQLYMIGSNIVKGISAAAVGIANQAQGDPYTAFPRMAAMAAIMAGLGFVVANNFGSSSGTAPRSNTGTGTVFGDVDAKSESITNAIEFLTDIDTRTMRYSAQMLDALRNIESSLAGVTNLVLRNGALTTGSNLGIFQGTLAVNKGDPILNMLRSDIGLGGLDLGGVTAGALDKLLGKIPFVAKLQSLWGKTTQEINAAGLFINGLLQELAAGGGVQQYADIKTTKSSFFGLSKNTSFSSQFAPVSPDIATQFGAIFSSFEDAVGAAGAPLGVSLDEINRRISGFVVDLGRIDLKDLSGEEIQERLSAVLGAAGDRIALAALPGLEAFQKVGEGYLETVVRVATSVETVAETLDMLGKAALQVGATGTAAAMSLVEAFGGLDELTKQTASYYEDFYSDAERAANTTRQLTEALADLGIGVLPSTKAAYRDLVSAQDLTTESGRKTYAALIGLSDVFAELKESIEEAGKSVREEIERLRGTSSGADEASVAAKFAITTAQARSGNADALAELPELSRALEEARAASATSAADLAFIRASIASSLADTLKALNIPGFANGGNHAGGWRVVGEVGPELEYTPPSRIFNQGQANSLINTEKLEAQVAALTAQVESLQSQLLAADTQQIIYTKRVADTLQSVANGAQSLATRAGD